MASHKEVLVQKFAESLIEKNGDEVLMNIMRDYKGHIAQKDIQKAIQHMEANDYDVSPFMKKLYKHFNKLKQNGKWEVLEKIFERINSSLANFHSKIMSRLFDINPADAEKYNSWLANAAKVAELRIYYHPIDWTSTYSVHTFNYASYLSPEWFEENRKVIEDYYCRENSYIPDSEANFVQFCNRFNFMLTRRDMYKAIVNSCFTSPYLSRSNFILLSSSDNLVDNMFNAFGNEFFDVFEEIVISSDMRSTNRICELGRYMLTKYNRPAIYQAYLNSLEPSEKLQLLKEFMGVSKGYSSLKREYNTKVIQMIFKSYGRKLSKSFVEKLAKSCKTESGEYFECCEILCGKDFMAAKASP